MRFFLYTLTTSHQTGRGARQAALWELTVRNVQTAYEPRFTSIRRSTWIITAEMVEVFSWFRKWYPSFWAG